GLVLQGEAGIGKSTIWQAALDAAGGRGYRVIVTRPTEAEARLPFAGLNDLVGDLVDTSGSELPRPQRTALDVALMRASVDEPLQPLALSLAVLELLRLASSSQTLALGIDDVQWLDESSAGVVRFALRRLESAQIIVIVTERTIATTVAPTIVADLPADRVVRVPVLALGTDEIDRLLASSLDLHLAPTMLRRVHRLAGGNPFFALEIGRTVRSGGGDPATGEVELPESLAGIVRARLSSLAADARDVVVHVAALSHPTAALLEAALGGERARAGLAEAREAAVLGPGDDPIRSTHPLLSSEAYGLLDEPDRRDLHRRLAAIVAEPEELARHLALGATGPDAAVADALDTAATHAHFRGAPDAAAELTELAAGLTPALDPRRARRMAAAGRYRLIAGDVGRARELLERALAEPVAKGGTARAELLFRLAGVRMLMDDFGASEQLGREALSHAGDDLALTVRIKLLLAGNAYITGLNWTSGSQHAFEAMELAEQSGDPRLLAAAIGAYASWRYATGHGHDPDLARRAAELEPWTGQFRTLDLPEFDLANIGLAEGETASAFARLRKLLERAEADGDYSSLPFLLGNVTLGDFIDGRSDVARARLDRAARLSQVTDQHVAHVHTLVWQARLAARLGDVERASAAGGEAFDLMVATSWRAGEWGMRTDLALLELSRGDPSSALDLVADAVDSTKPDESGRRHWGQAVAVDALVALGRIDEARSVLTVLEAHAQSHGSPRLIADGLRARARLLAADGDVDGADAAIAEAEAIHRRIDDPWELARTLLVAGEVHRRSRRRARARAALREALETFAFLGARLWARRAREELARIDAGRREEGGLTPTQRRVAELVGSGLTNRQVADRLSMSAHTVDAHLKAIYLALGINSRAQLRAATTADRTATRDSAGGSRDSGPS
ncbi:MAG: AAA family ATPase, partial [Chloroflexi bacterium]|nr:AAA family ATPase [Chloroflexota bacterium]